MEEPAPTKALRNNSKRDIRSKQERQSIDGPESAPGEVDRGNRARRCTSNGGKTIASMERHRCSHSSAQEPLPPLPVCMCGLTFRMAGSIPLPCEDIERTVDDELLFSKAVCTALEETVLLGTHVKKAFTALSRKAPSMFWKETVRPPMRPHRHFRSSVGPL